MVTFTIHIPQFCEHIYHTAGSVLGSMVALDRRVPNPEARGLHSLACHRFSLDQQCHPVESGDESLSLASLAGAPWLDDVLASDLPDPSTCPSI